MKLVSECRRFVGFLLVVSLVLAQDYNADYQDFAHDYADDPLYHDYAQHLQEKGQGG
jgi:hypothetical protein